jgi:UDP-N-acetylglucosamine 2-epimerase (non-hydrolysing)
MYCWNEQAMNELGLNMSTAKQTIVFVIGTRPEAIKMAPVITSVKSANWARCVVITTGQHRGLLDQMLVRFGIKVDHDLNLMTEGQQLGGLIARMLPELERIFIAEAADVILAQGDTATTFVSALAAFQQKIPFGHVEAGLRTHNLDQPFPEEGYRQMVSRIARWHFAPTSGAAKLLYTEGISSELVHVTGNTGIDTLIQTMRSFSPVDADDKRMILLTAHRRENFGEPLRNIFRAVLRLIKRYDDVEVVYPVHPNPNVRSVANELLAGNPRIRLVDPLDYFEFVDAMRRSMFILTDSGGVQEEAPAIGRPVLVLRESTERPEAISLGVGKLIGVDEENILHQCSRLLDDPDLYDSMAKCVYPYGDGQAAPRILRILKDSLFAN